MVVIFVFILVLVTKIALVDTIPMQNGECNCHLWITCGLLSVLLGINLTVDSGPE